MQIATSITIFLALLFSANALNLNEDIVNDVDNVLYDAIGNIGGLWQHFKQTKLSVIKAKIVCVEQYAQTDYQTIRDGGAQVLQCVHTTTEAFEKLQSSKFGQKRIGNFRSKMQACQSKIKHASLRLDCYSDVITYYANMLDLIKAPYVKEAKACINLKLQLIERKLENARETYTQCKAAAVAPAPAQPEPQPEQQPEPDQQPDQQSDPQPVQQPEPQPEAAAMPANPPADAQGSQ